MGKSEFTFALKQELLPIDGWGQFRRGARRAAVAVVLYKSKGSWSVPFVKRRGDMRDHPGQVALPGGGVHAGESAWEAAAREVSEEIGVPVDRIVPLGAGDPIYTAVSNFSVVPFVAHLPDPVEPFVHDSRELEGVLEIPLEKLLDDSAWEVSAEPWRFRYLPWDGSVVWGLTERLLAGLLPRVGRALGSRAPG